MGGTCSACHPSFLPPQPPPPLQYHHSGGTTTTSFLLLFHGAILSEQLSVEAGRLLLLRTRVVQYEHPALLSSHIRQNTFKHNTTHTNIRKSSPDAFVNTQALSFDRSSRSSRVRSATHTIQRNRLWWRQRRLIIPLTAATRCGARPPGRSRALGSRARAAHAPPWPAACTHPRGSCQGFRPDARAESQ